MPELTCGYSHPFDLDYKCGRTVWDDSEDGFCIFHEPRKDKNVKLFNEGIARKLKGEDYDFRGYVFPGDTHYFKGHRFDKTTRFDCATFLGDRTSFFRAQFRGERTDFYRAKFNGERIDFSSAQFSGKLTSFHRAQFSGELTDFSDTQFSGQRTDFTYAKFSGQRTSFSYAKFSGQRTFFALAQFSSERTDFTYAEFSGKGTFFALAQFSGERTDFSYAEFSGKGTYFAEAKFSGKGTDFSKAVFSGQGAYFAGAEFSGEQAGFSFAKFSGERTDFSFAQFSGERTDFSSAEFSGQRIDFIEAEFMGQAVIFRRVDLSRVFFGDFKLLNRMDLTDIEAWGKKKYYLGLRKRNTCADEVAARDAEEFKAASRTLAALENVARANHNASLASDFAYARKECDRRARPNALIRLLLLILGAGFVGWGEKLSNIAFSSVIVVLILAFVFLFSGINVKGNAPNDIERPINREFSFVGWKEMPGTLADFSDCLYFSVVTFTTLGYGYGDMRPAGSWSKGLVMFESFFGIFVLAIFSTLYGRKLLT